MKAIKKIQRSYRLVALTHLIIISITVVQEIVINLNVLALSNPENFFYGVNRLAYNSSKTALNALTVSLAKDLAEDKISVNSICPGWVKTDMGTDAVPRTVQQGAAIIVKMATISNSPTGKFLDDNGEILW